MTKPTHNSAQEKFESLCFKHPDILCWQWLGTTNRGYGSFTHHNKPYYAHRFSYELYKGPIPKHLEISHICDNPGCCNPEHLELATHAENQAKLRGKKRRSKMHQW